MGLAPLPPASLSTGPLQWLCLLSLPLLSLVPVVFPVALPPVLAPKFKPSNAFLYTFNHLAPGQPALGALLGGVILTATPCQDRDFTMGSFPIAESPQAPTCLGRAGPTVPQMLLSDEKTGGLVPGSSPPSHLPSPQDPAGSDSPTQAPSHLPVASAREGGHLHCLQQKRFEEPSQWL